MATRRAAPRGAGPGTAALARQGFVGGAGQSDIPQPVWGGGRSRQRDLPAKEIGIQVFIQPDEPLTAEVYDFWYDTDGTCV